MRHLFFDFLQEDLLANIKEMKKKKMFSNTNKKKERHKNNSLLKKQEKKINKINFVTILIIKGKK